MSVQLAFSVDFFIRKGKSAPYFYFWFIWPAACIYYLMFL